MRPAGMSSDEDDDDEYDYGFDDPEERKKKPVYQYQPPRPIFATQSEKVNRQLNAKYEKDRALSEFHIAVESGDFEAVENFLQQGVPIDGSFPGQWTALMKACAKGDHDMVEYLLENGANPNLHKELFTPIMACCTVGYTLEEDKAHCLRLLLQYNANPNAKDKHRETALIHASANGFAELVNILLATPNIDINAQDKEGWSALFYAVNDGHKAVVERLLSAGINESLRELRNGYTALDIALAKNLIEIAELLGHSESYPEVEVEVQRKDPLNEFLSELPDELGNGGFNEDVRHMLSGVGVVNIHDKLNKKISLPDFLNTTDAELFEIGVKFAPTRKKILNSIHKYHLHPWKKTSMHEIISGNQGDGLEAKEFRLEDVIYIVSTTVKHLVIMHASLKYLKTRIVNAAADEDKKEESIINSELIPTLIESYKEINQLKQILKRLMFQVNQIKIVGTVQADFVGPEDYNIPKKSRSSYMWPILGTIIGGLFYYFKTKR